jgi:asparagine synthase (glutamine-hydrolysing)
MCGIVGVALRRPAENPEALVAQRDAISHRGPDDAGLWWSEDRRVGLAHRRLSIHDLTAAGHQPMEGWQGQQIVFTSEIYTFREIRRELEGRGYAFRTGTDTEVLLAGYDAWGTGLLERLNGMFAVDIWDPRARQLLLSRDRAGEKPLFYYRNGDRFASELKALLADPSFPRRLDREALEHHLAYGYVPFDRCILEDYHKLPQGHALIYRPDTHALRVWPYWSLPDAAPPATADREELVAELEALLTDAVRRQLVADVPVGVLLSGGLDSSLVTAVAARVSPAALNTFTISFPGSGRFDEAPYARLVADHFGTSHTELVAEPAHVELLPELARQYDEPIADSSVVPTFLVPRLIRRHATVALGGDGGDELFGGYTWYSRFLRQERVRRYIPGPVRQAAGMAVAYGVPSGFRGRGYLLAATADLPGSMAQQGVLFDARSRRRLLASARGPLRSEAPERFRQRLCDSGHTPLQRMTGTDFRSYLVDDILVKVDRASMLTSLEVRAPWLDYRIVEFAHARVPDSLRATTGEKKILPRLLGERLLPEALDLKRKQGFSIPLEQWVRGEWGGFFREVLEGGDDSIFDPRTVQQLLAAGGPRSELHTHRLFALTMFELWRREYRVSA